jgi:predicted alpha/beta hydrolase
MYSVTGIRTKDGKNIMLNCYAPGKHNGKVMIIAATGGVTKEYYDPFACFFQQQGYVVITFDYRGVGSSGPRKLKGYKASMQQWAVQDIDAVILFAKNNCPGREIIYAGHCIGGEIIGLAQASQYINKLVLINCALSCRKLWPLKDRFRIIAMKSVIRVASGWFGYFPGRLAGLQGNLPGGVMNEWANWCSNPNGLFDAFPDNNYRKLNIPLLCFSFSDDWLCPPKAVKELLNRFSNAIITWHHFKPEQVGLKRVGHGGFFKNRMQATGWSILLKWELGICN